LYMKMNKLPFLLFFALFLSPLLVQAQDDDDDFDMSDFTTAADAKVFVNNKVNGLSPTKLISVSFDYVGENTWESTQGDEFVGTYPTNESTFSRNYGLRLETNYPIISNNRLIVNAYLNYWESRYSASGSEPPIGQLFDSTPLRTTTAGALIFKPLNAKNFLLFQLEGAMNGNYNFGSINPDLSKIKVSAAALYGWKPNDDTNVAVGVTRTYRGGRVLHIPVLMWNKTFNSKWGIETLLPARGALRRNFSTKSIVMLGYELEGQSYHIQGEDDTSVSPVFNSNATTNDWELRKSEIRARLSWDKSITDFIWFNVQAGAVITYRMDIDGMSDDTQPWIANDVGIPFYFRIGIQLVSP
ncbi:MAG: hypothetical protein ACPGJS_22560, partial [Flammeovirgaceae bacterium]